MLRPLIGRKIQWPASDYYKDQKAGSGTVISVDPRLLVETDAGVRVLLQGFEASDFMTAEERAEQTPSSLK